MKRQVKERRFRSVAEIFETFIPGYVPSPSDERLDTEDELGPDAGSQLAQQLLKRFQTPAKRVR